MLSVKHLKALYVLQLNTIRQRFPLEVNVWELRKCSGCIWDVTMQNTHVTSHYTTYFISPRINPKRRLCWTHPGTAGTAEPACWCQPVLTLAAVAAAGLPLLQCHWSSLQLYAQASTWQEYREVIVVKLAVTSDPCPDQAPDTFFHPWKTTHSCGCEVTGMEGRPDYSCFWAEENPKPEATLTMFTTPGQIDLFLIYSIDLIYV